MNILIIDDAEADHELAKEYLRTASGDENYYTFYDAYSAEEGLSLYRKHAVDCILLDYHMPDRDGLEVLRQLTQAHKVVPVIMMTGEGNEFVAVTAMKLGSQDYIPKKTLTPAALKRAVERTIERTEMIERMECYRAELERSNRDLEQFANIVAHDLKSPLRAVTQHLKLIEDKNAALLDDRSKRSLGFAVEGAVRMRQLIDALFEYAHIGFTEPKMATVELETLLEQLLRDIAPVLQDSGGRVTHDKLPVVYGDPVLIAQLMQNLICNALKYSQQVPMVHISAKTKGEHCRIEVRDNGIGIPAAQHKQIFAIFRRLHQDEDYPGIGLGLAICDRIVKQHGGEIGVESEPGKGSVFYFTLPSTSTQVLQQKRMAYG